MIEQLGSDFPDSLYWWWLFVIQYESAEAWCRVQVGVNMIISYSQMYCDLLKTCQVIPLVIIEFSQWSICWEMIPFTKFGCHNKYRAEDLNDKCRVESDSYVTVDKDFPAWWTRQYSPMWEGEVIK